MWEQLANKHILITGVMNKKSIAYHVANLLQKAKASIILSVQNQEVREKISSLFPDVPIYCCDLSKENDIELLYHQLNQEKISLAGILHSVAYGKIEEGRPFHETPWDDFQEALKISAFSLMSLAKILRPLLIESASVVTVSISNVKVAAYGYLGPIKGLLDLLVPYLAHSFADFSQIRFNAVCAGPLKTAASAGLPHYMENYLYSEQLMLRKKGLKVEEVANTILFLLSSLSSGINGERIVVDGGMSCNYFDKTIVNNFFKSRF